MAFSFLNNQNDYDKMLNLYFGTEKLLKTWLYGGHICKCVMPYLHKTNG